MQFTDIQVLIRTNPDFTGTLLDHGKKAYDEIMATEFVPRGQGDLARADLLLGQA